MDIHKKSDNDNDEGDEDQGRATLVMIKPPRKSIIEMGKPVCHLLTWGDAGHVALIPDIQKYLDKILTDRRKSKNKMAHDIKDRRCPYCFGVLKDRQALISHVRSGLCYRNKPQPSIVILPEPGAMLPFDDIYKSEPPVLTVIADSESRLIKPPSDEKSAEDFSQIFDYL